MRCSRPSASPLTRWALESCCCLMCSRFLRFPALALSASFLGMRKLRANPSETSRTSPRRPTLATSSSRMIFMPETLVRRHVRPQGHRPGALDGVRELALMTRAAARDAAWNDLAALGDEAAEPSHVLVVDEADLVRTELADLPPPESAALHGLLDRRNCSALLCQNGTSSSPPPLSSAKAGAAAIAGGAPAPAPLVRLMN